MSPNTEKFLNWAGLVLLILCFLIALTRVFQRVIEQADPENITIRFAHWQLEPGLRDAFDTIARQYEEKTGAGVRIEQMAIPERVYTQWLRTRLVGQNAPQLIQWGIGAQEELLARFFEPLTPWLREPNPYNEGTELEGVPWRETFLDGLSGTFSPNLMDYYMVSTSMFTTRVFYNRELWEEIFGEAVHPASYEEFIGILEAVQEYARQSGRTVMPISGSRYNAPMMIDNLFASQMQRKVQEFDASRVMGADNVDLALAFLRGEWSMSSQAVLNGLRLMRSVGRFMPPGFLQLNREDAVFYFVQGRALMTSSGSWDSPSLRQQAPFPIGVFPMPLPSPDHPEYGPFLFGLPSEAVNTQGPFAMVRDAPHREATIDFLHFLTSQKSNQTFVNESGWLPSVRGVRPTPEIEPFMPVLDGYIPGMALRFDNFGGDVARAYETNLHNLFTPTVQVEEFALGYQRQLERAFLADFERRQRSDTHSALRKDSVWAAFLALENIRPETAHSFQERRDQLFETQTMQEFAIYRIERELSDLLSGSQP